MADERTSEMTRPMRRVEARLGRPLADVLRELYVDRALTLAAVGAELGQLAQMRPLSEATVSRWMDSLDIDRRFPGQRAKVQAL